MQPCAVCGGIGVDASGYCVNCRTYRGVAGRSAQSDYGMTNGAPYYGAPSYSSTTSDYRDESPGYPRYPAALPSGPSTEVPYSAGADSGAFPLHRDAESHRSRRGRSKLPSVLVAVTLLGLAVVLVTVLRGRDGAEEPLVDPCVVGNWTVQNMTMAIETDAFGKIRFVSLGEIGKIEYGADGTAVHAYGDEARLSAEVTVSAVSQQAILTITGVDRYDYRTSDSTMVFSSLRDDRTTTLTIDGIGVSSDIDINMGLEPARFSCAGDSLTTFTENYRAEAHRDS